MNAILAIPNLIEYSKQSSTLTINHELFNDPAAELKFLSEDEVVFRVSSWHMKKKIGFIQDMLDVTGAKHGIDDYIHLRVGSEILDYFFPSFYGGVHQYIDLDWYECQLLLKLADQFQAPDVERALLKGMAYHGWRVFEIAAEKDMPDIGKACIKHFDKDPTPADALPGKCYATTKGDLNKIPTAWALELLRCRISEKYETDKSGTSTRTWRKRKWADGADSFSP